MSATTLTRAVCGTSFPCLPDWRRLCRAPVPDNCSITVAGEERQWVEGEPMLFDDSYEHHVSHPIMTHCPMNVATAPSTLTAIGVWLAASVAHWQVSHKGEGERVVLLFDTWHPDLSAGEIRQICAMFDHARDQGWMK